MTRLILLRKTKKDVMMILGCFHSIRFSLNRNYMLNVKVWELNNIAHLLTHSKRLWENPEKNRITVTSLMDESDIP